MIAPRHLEYGGAAEKYRSRVAMEVACWRTADSLRFHPLHIPHAVAVMVMALNFHTEDLDGLGYALNILFPRPLPIGRVGDNAPHVEVD